MCGDVGLYARTAMPLARPGARRPRSVAATTGGRMGMRGAGGRRVHHLRGVGRRMAHHPETSASGHFSGMPTRSRHARGAVAPER
jgi:hypothetical protein